MKVVLATPPNPNEGAFYRAFYPSMGLLYLASNVDTYCDVRNITVDYIEGSQYNFNNFVFKIVSLNPDVIGLSFPTILASLVYQVINRLKEKLPNCLIVCGGPHTTVAAAEVLQKSRADVCVIGEGEITFGKILEALQKKTVFSQIEGIAFRSGEVIVRTPLRPLIPDLDSIKLPAWDKINVKNYQGYTIQKAWPDMSIVSTRGCPFDCNFCGNPVWKLSKPWIRFRSPENIAQEVKYLADLGVREIYDHAAEFNADPKWATKVAAKISDLGLDLNFKCMLRADRITEEFAQSLSKMGCWLASIGIESGNQEVVNGINKNLSLNQVAKGLKLLKKNGITTFGFFMVFNMWEENGALRFETPEMCRHTLAFARQLLSERLLDHISWSTATPFPGSKLYDIALKHDLLDKTIPFSEYNLDKCVFTLPGVSKGDMSRIKFQGMFLEAYNSIIHGGVNLKNSALLMRKFRSFVDMGIHGLISK